MAGGWIKLYRSVLDSLVWEINEPLDKKSAWIYLLLRANSEKKVIVVNGEKLTIKRGQLFTSIRKLAQEYRWNRDKVCRYLQLLEDAGMITRTRTHNGTLLTLINYGDYQGVSDTNKDTNKDANKDTNKDTNKDANNTQTRRKNKEERNNNISEPAPEGAAQNDDDDDDDDWDWDWSKVPEPWNHETNGSKK